MGIRLGTTSLGAINMKLFFSILIIVLLTVTAYPQWTQMWTDNNDTTAVWGLFVKDSIVFIGTNGSSISGTFRSSNNGLSWFRNQYGLTGNAIYSNSFTSKDSFIFAATYDGVFRTKISDTVWTFRGSGIPFGYSNNAIVNHNGKLFVVLSNASVYKSTDDGLSWEISSNGLPVNAANSWSILNYSDTLFLGTTAGVYRTINDGEVWESISVPPVVGIEGMCMLANYLYITTIDKIYRTNNNGITWHYIFLPNFANTIASVDTFVFVGTGDGILRGSLNDLEWDIINNGLPSMTGVTKIFQNDEYLFISTYGKGIWRISLNDVLTDVKDIRIILPEQYYLFQNYPNPFNSNTIIKYQLPVQGYVRLNIYDILGRKIMTLVEGSKEAGSYQIDFDGGDLSSGIYLYQIETSSYTNTKKFILLK